MKDRLRENLLDEQKEGTLNAVEWLEKHREAVMDLAECGVSSAVELWRRIDEEIKFFVVENKMNDRVQKAVENLDEMLHPHQYKLEQIHSGVYGNHMTRKEFVEQCKAGSFIDYDGFGEYATATHVSDVRVNPSDVKNGGWLDSFFTHVVWYNR